MALVLNGVTLATTPLSNPYRPAGVAVDMALVRAAMTASGPNHLQVQVCGGWASQLVGAARASSQVDPLMLSRPALTAPDGSAPAETPYRPGTDQAGGGDAAAAAEAVCVGAGAAAEAVAVGATSVVGPPVVGVLVAFGRLLVGAVVGMGALVGVRVGDGETWLGRVLAAVVGEAGAGLLVLGWMVGV